MKQVRKCKYCGKEFVARSGMQKFCCEECQTKAKEARKKRQQDFMNAMEPVIGLQNQEYLTFAKAAILMGCSRQYVYKLVNEGKLRHRESAAGWRLSERLILRRCWQGIRITECCQRVDPRRHLCQHRGRKYQKPRNANLILMKRRCLITFLARRSCASIRSRNRGSILPPNGTKCQYVGLLG